MSRPKYTKGFVCLECTKNFQKEVYSYQKVKYCQNCLPVVKQRLRVEAAQSPQHRETARQIGLANKGKRVGLSGEKHHAWKGDSVGIDALHSWVMRHKTDPQHCEHCGAEDKKLEWSNISQTYKRDLDDFQRLCRSCHLSYDNKMGVRNGSQKAVYSGIF